MELQCQQRFLPPPLYEQGPIEDLSTTSVSGWRGAHLFGTRVVAYVPVLKTSPSWSCTAPVACFVVEVQRSSEGGAHIWTCLLVHEPVSPCALLAGMCPSECVVRAVTRPVCQGTQQESVASGASFCTCFADGLLEIQLSCQLNDTVLPFCELCCADRSLLLSARIYFFFQDPSLVL